MQASLDNIFTNSFFFTNRKFPTFKGKQHYFLSAYKHTHVKKDKSFLKLVPNHMWSISSGPCALSEIHAEAHCTIDTILVRWENTEDSTVFVVSAEDTNHDFTYCNSTADTCILPNMFCGMEYSVIVSASSNRCSNLRSPPKKIKTGISLLPLEWYIPFAMQYMS